MKAICFPIFFFLVKNLFDIHFVKTSLKKTLSYWLGSIDSTPVGDLADGVAGSADCKCIVCLYFVLRSRTVCLYRSAKSLNVIELEDIG